MTKRKSDRSADAETEAPARADAIPPPPPDPAPTPEALSVLELAKRLDTKGWQFAAAAALHRWRIAEHNTGSWPALSEADFIAAVEAACSPKGHQLKPHKPALYSEA